MNNIPNIHKTLAQLRRNIASERDYPLRVATLHRDRWIDLIESRTEPHKFHYNDNQRRICQANVDESKQIISEMQDAKKTLKDLIERARRGPGGGGIGMPPGFNHHNIDEATIASFNNNSIGFFNLSKFNKINIVNSLFFLTCVTIVLCYIIIYIDIGYIITLPNVDQYLHIHV